MRACFEQLTGVPVESKARSQSNLVMHPTSGFSNIDKFSNMTIPMFWAEYVSIYTYNNLENIEIERCRLFIEALNLAK